MNQARWQPFNDAELLLLLRGLRETRNLDLDRTAQDTVDDLRIELATVLHDRAR